MWNTLYSNHFLNMLFMNSSNKPLYAWVMNFTPNWVAIWVKLPNGVPAARVLTLFRALRRVLIGLTRLFSCGHRAP